MLPNDPTGCENIARIAASKTIFHRGQKRYDIGSFHFLEYRRDATAVRL